MKNRIKQHLTENKSYFKWSAARIADKFGCSVRTVNQVLSELTTVKANYLNSLKA